MQRSFRFIVDRRIGPGGTIVMEVVLYPRECHPRRAPEEMIRVRISGKDGSSGHAIVEARTILGHAALAEWLSSDSAVTKVKDPRAVDNE